MKEFTPEYLQGSAGKRGFFRVCEIASTYLEA